MMNCNFGEVQLGVPADATDKEENAMLCADLSCIFEAMCNNFGNDRTVDIITTALKLTFDLENYIKEDDKE